MNDLKLSIFFIIIGIGLIYWEMQIRSQKKKKGIYSEMDTAKFFSGVSAGAIFILGGIFHLILVF